MEGTGLEATETAEIGEAAGFWRRLGGAFVDGIVVSIVGAILRVLLGNAAGEALTLVVAAVYFTYFHGSTGVTPGNAALGIRVVDLRDERGRPIGFWRAFVRWVVSLVSGIVFLLGYLWMLWDSEQQTWHDKASGSLPVRTR
jgi:uncharacterized RDD family membrane protein YckC